MATVVSTPVLAWIASILTAGGVVQSGSLTATIVLPAGFEVLCPVGIQLSNVSADPIVKIFPSTDGGANYDTVPALQFAISRVAASTVKTSFRLPTGVYAIQLLNSGPNSATFTILTQQILTAIQNV